MNPLLLIGLIASLGAGGGVVHGRTKRVKVPNHARWDQPVVLCQVGVTEEALETALNWWRSLGWDIYQGCDEATRVTMVVTPGMSDRGLSIIYGQKPVEWVDIFIQSGSDSLAVAHELGHALGFDHPKNAPTGHLMHWRDVGWDGRGLARKR